MSIADGPWRRPACTFRCVGVRVGAHVYAHVCAYVRVCMVVWVCVGMCACVRACVRVNVLAVLPGVFTTGASMSVDCVSVWAECVD